MAKIGNAPSKKRYISCGVPHSNILRSIKISSLIWRFFLFADNSSTLLIKKILGKLKDSQKELENVKIWLDSNELSVNVYKSVLVSIIKKIKESYHKTEHQNDGGTIKRKKIYYINPSVS